jgi:hypothetical protein
MRFALLLLLLPFLALGRAPVRYQDRPLALHTLVDGQTLPTLASGTGGTFTADLDFPLSGTQSVRLTATSASLVRWTFTFPSTNICNDSFVELTFRVPTQASVTNLNTLEMWLGDFTNNLKYEFGSFDIRDTGITYHGQWAQVRFPIRRFALTGTYDCATATRIMLGLKAQTATPDTISIARVASYPKRDETGIVIINEDDEWGSWDTLATPTLIALGFKSNIFVNGGRIGVTNFMSAADLRRLCGTGLFKLSNHGLFHDSITDLTLDSAHAWLARNAAIVRSFGRGCDESSIGAYPYGKHSRPVDSAMRAWKGQEGMPDYMRLTKGASAGEAQNFNSPYAMRVVSSLGITVDTTTAKGIVDVLVTQRTAGIFLFHQICASCTPSDGNTWRQDWFISLMNYIATKVAAGQLRVMTMGEYLQQYGGYTSSRRAGIGR